MTDRERRRRRIRTSHRAGDSSAQVDDAPVADLPVSVVNALNTALKDERNAYATYQAILDWFGDVRPFSNIIHAEARHIEALLNLFDRYGVPVPEEPGEVHPSAGDADLKALCQVALDGEIENTRLYDEALLPTVAGYPDIEAVLRRLRDASWNNHRPAFERCAARLG